eukprot:TRINITY_DN43962_c0_g1_i1.p1 TRINITY_DN43962_c0_g1~~TRINITY_DN43962_c0_g1_i1.p1  ORF type:complete len:446 (-),score=106.18 TRINITY_DN43962_c0_g1_i1:92-1429(-)
MFSHVAAVPPGSINTNIYASRPNREADRYLLREQRFQQQRMERVREQLAKEEKELQELQKKQEQAPKKEENKDSSSLLGKKDNVETGKTGAATKSASADLSASLARTRLGVGVRVVTSGLKAEMHNGKSGICLKFEAASGRWIVRIDETGEPAGLKPENLVVLPGKDAGGPSARDKEAAAAKLAEKPIDETQEEFLKMQREAKAKLAKGINPDDLGRRHLNRVGPEKDDRQQSRRFRERGESRERRSRSRDAIVTGRSGEDSHATSDPYMMADEKESGGSGGGAGDTQDKSSAARARTSSAAAAATGDASQSRRRAQRYDDEYSYYSPGRRSWSRSRSRSVREAGCRARGGSADSRDRASGGGAGRRRRDDSREDAVGSRRARGGGSAGAPALRGSSRSPSLSQEADRRRRSERSAPRGGRARSRRGGADRRGAATGGNRRRGAD